MARPGLIYFLSCLKPLPYTITDKLSLTTSINQVWRLDRGIFHFKASGNTVIGIDQWSANIGIDIAYRFDGTQVLKHDTLRWIPISTSQYLHEINEAYRGLYSV